MRPATCSGLSPAAWRSPTSTTTQGLSGITVSGSTFTGWTLGVGADIAITRSWIARVEYLHDDFGDKNFLIDNDPYRVKLTGDTVRGALMYKF